MPDRFRLPGRPRRPARTPVVPSPGVDATGPADARGIGRDDAIAVATSYLQGGLVAHDSSRPLLAPSIFRHENAWATGDERIIRDHFPHMTFCLGLRDLRWVVEGPWAAVRYELLLDEQFGHTKPVAEWFHVEGGAVTEVAAVFPLARWMLNAEGPGTDECRRHLEPPADRTPAARATVALAEQLIAAVAAGTPNDAPLGDDCTLTENGELVARGRDAVVAKLHRDVDAITAKHWVAEGAEALGRLEAHRPGAFDVWGLHVRAFDGVLRELDLVWGPGPGETLLAQWEDR